MLTINNIVIITITIIITIIYSQSLVRKTKKITQLKLSNISPLN